MTADHYFTLHQTLQNFTGKLTTAHVTQCILNAKPIVFTKFGDGEYQCMANFKGANCDGDAYTPELGKRLQEAFVGLCDASYVDPEAKSIVLGKWHYPQEVRYYCDLYRAYQRPRLTGSDAFQEIPFVNYHLIYNDDHFNKNNNLFEFVKALKDCPKPKLLVCNLANKRLEKLFKAQTYIEIPSKCWFQSYNGVKQKVFEYFASNPNGVMLIAGGLASKILIWELNNAFPNATLLDIGSGFDILARAYGTRDHKHHYRDEVEYYQTLLPDDWER